MSSTQEMILLALNGGNPNARRPEPAQEPEIPTNIEHYKRMFSEVWSEPAHTGSQKSKDTILLKANCMNLVVTLNLANMDLNSREDEHSYSLKLFSILSATIAMWGQLEEQIVGGDESKKTLKQREKLAKQLDEIIETIDKVSESVTVYIL